MCHGSREQERHASSRAWCVFEMAAAFSNVDQQFMCTLVRHSGLPVGFRNELHSEYCLAHAVAGLECGGGFPMWLNAGDVSRHTPCGPQHWLGQMTHDTCALPGLCNIGVVALLNEPSSSEPPPQRRGARLLMQGSDVYMSQTQTSPTRHGSIVLTFY